MKRTFRFAQYERIATFLSSATVRAGSGFSAGCAHGLSVEDPSSPGVRDQVYTSKLCPALLRERAPVGTGPISSNPVPVSLSFGRDASTLCDRPVLDGPTRTSLMPALCARLPQDSTAMTRFTQPVHRAQTAGAFVHRHRAGRGDSQAHPGRHLRALRARPTEPGIKFNMPGRLRPGLAPVGELAGPPRPATSGCPQPGFPKRPPLTT